MGNLREVDPKVYAIIKKEEKRQENSLELIASENFTSSAVLEAQGSCLTNKYAEGYPGRRWYDGCEFMDDVETLAIKRAKEVFGGEHVNVQPHSGSQANMAVYFAALDVGDKILALDLACGGHLTHGHRHNFSGRLYDVACYGLDPKTEMINYDDVLNLARRHKPKMILAGASAYSRKIDFKKFRKIADDVGAYLFVDMAHVAGLVAAGLYPSPVPYAEFVTSTAHKTLRGPRSGFIICRNKFAKRIDMQVFPGIQGGPLMHVVAAKAVAFREARGAAFRKYQHQVVKNAKALAGNLEKKGLRIVSGGTDTHLLLVDLQNRNISGADAAIYLDKADITVNKNLIPFDSTSATITSGIRLGTAAVTTRGMEEKEMEKIAEFIDCVLGSYGDDKVCSNVKREVLKLTKKFPLHNK